MSIWEDYYNILQVHYNAEPEVIEGAYRRLCKKYHPDINKDINAEELIKKINIAYEILKDPIKRKDYHRRWLDRNKTLHMNKDEKREWKKGFHTIIDEKAHKVLNEYLLALSCKNFEKAYHMLSSYNKKNIAVDDFIEWQSTVSKLYAIGDYKTRIFNTYSNMTLNKVSYGKVIEFEISMSEKNVLTSLVSKYQFTKALVLEKDIWKIYLEYNDIKALTHKFKYLFHMHQKPSASQLFAEFQLTVDEITGLLNKKGFTLELEKEKNRFIRYSNNFSIAVFSLKFLNNNAILLKEEMIKYAAYLIKHSIRNTDTAAYLGNEVFSVIFTETTYDNAKSAILKLCTSLKDDFYKHYNLEAIINYGLSEHSGRDAYITLRKACNLAGIEMNNENEHFEDIEIGM